MFRSAAEQRKLPNFFQQPIVARLGLLAIVAIAFLLRFWTVDFGLPDLLDPDEPLFILLGARMIQQGTLNPHWFGHPGTTTIYGIVAIELLFAGAAAISGGFPQGANAPQFIIDHVTNLVMAERTLIVVFGTLTVFLTYRLARQVTSLPAALLSALLLAINPLHVQLSQIVRTDIEATAFMLGCLLFCARIARAGRRRDYVAAGICLAAACATKWPAAIVATGIIGAFLAAIAEPAADRRRQATNLALAGISAVAALMVISPYIFLDYHVVVANLGGEAQISHLGATGGGLIENIGWYLSGPIRRSFTTIGLVAGLIGIASTLGNRIMRNVLVATAIAFIVAISTQHLVWDRWAVPVLPLFAIFAAAGVERLYRAATTALGRFAGAAGAALLGMTIVVPMTARTTAQAIEMRHDTRLEAAAWMHARISPGATVLYEYFAVHALEEPWRILYPAGRLGCVDVQASLAGGTSLDDISAFRGGRSIVDIGTIDPSQLARCDADYAVFTHYDRYLAAGPTFAAELETYRRLVRGGREVAVFRPATGRVGGPVVRIYQLARRQPAEPRTRPAASQD